jgi:aldehyde:ferredoxin oxidoreductase
MELRFGDAAVMVRLTEMIGRREGFGDMLAEGSARAAAMLGRGSEELVVAVKGQEVPAHMPQVKRSLALIYAVNPFGADHQSHEHDPSWKSHPARLAEIGFTDPPHRTRSSMRARFGSHCRHSTPTPAWTRSTCANSSLGRPGICMAWRS